MEIYRPSTCNHLNQNCPVLNNKACKSKTWGWPHNLSLCWACSFSCWIFLLFQFPSLSLSLSHTHTHASACTHISKSKEQVQVMASSQPGTDEVIVAGNMTFVCHDPERIGSTGIWLEHNPLNYATPLLLLQLVVITLTSVLIDLCLQPQGQSSIVSKNCVRFFCAFFLLIIQQLTQSTYPPMPKDIQRKNIYLCRKDKYTIAINVNKAWLNRNIQRNC